MRVCIESKYIYREYNQNCHRAETDVTLTFWPDGRIKSSWKITGPMLAELMKSLPRVFTHVGHTKDEDTLLIRMSIAHDDLIPEKERDRIVCQDLIDAAVNNVEKSFRLKLRLGIKKVEKYLDTHGSLAQHICHLHTRLDTIEKKLNEHKNRYGRYPHGTKSGGSHNG